MPNQSSDEQTQSWNRAHFLAWSAGALALQIPFQLRYKLGDGNFGYNLLFGTLVFAAGVLVVVGLVRLCRPAVHCPRLTPLLDNVLTGGFGAASACFLAALLPGGSFAFYWLGLALLAGALLFAIGWAVRTRAFSLSQRAFSRAQRNPWRFNGAFWMVVFLILLARDLWALEFIAQRSASETALLLLGRFLNLAALTVGLMLLARATSTFFPVGLRWVAAVGASLVPLVVIADFAAELYWQQSLLEVLNSLTIAGKIDLGQQLEAAGITYHPLVVIVFILALLALSAGVYFALHNLSNRFALRTRTGQVFMVFALLWLSCVGQQALSKALLRKDVWQAEHAAFKLHLGILAPAPGKETIPVQFAAAPSEERREALLANDLPSLARTPDIYVIMVETWRADTITPQVAPFLSRFRDEECQHFNTTLAGSNCTPVSWFTFFHSRLGIHWSDAVDQRDRPGGLPGAYPLRLLHKLGYQVSARGVCDFDYLEMGDLNFGHAHRLADEFLDQSSLSDTMGIPEREMIVVDDLKRQLLATTPGGHLHFLSLDSPHYNYYWPSKDFEPLHHDCANTINYASFNPSAEEIRGIVKRYQNSINWIDRQIEDLVNFLKKHGRYEDSVIILTGDHGEEFQEFGSWFHCSNLKHPQTAVPILIKWPEWIGEAPRQPVATHLDVMPSILDALGLDDRYFEHLAGRSLLRPHPGEVILSSRWSGTSRVGICFVKEGMKANFATSFFSLDPVPKRLHFMGYADLEDRPLDLTEARGGLTHTEFLRQNFPDLTTRFFSPFGEIESESAD